MVSSTEVFHVLTKMRQSTANVETETSANTRPCSRWKHETFVNIHIPFRTLYSSNPLWEFVAVKRMWLGLRQHRQVELDTSSVLSNLENISLFVYSCAELKHAWMAYKAYCM